MLGDRPRPTRLLLVRHGESTSNREGIISGWSEAALTPRGREQVRRASEAITKCSPVDAIYSSPLPRAWETASVVGAAVGVNPVAMPDLREIDVGQAEGRAYADVLVEHPDLERQSDEDGLDVAWPGGESQRQLRERVVQTVREILSRHRGETVVIVAHGGPLGWLVAVLTADPRPGFPDWRHSNCGISELTIGGGGLATPALLIRHNDCSHLIDLS